MLLLGEVIGPTVGLCCMLGEVMGPTVGLCCYGSYSRFMLLLGEVMGQFGKHLVYKPSLSG